MMLGGLLALGGLGLGWYLGGLLGVGVGLLVLGVGSFVTGLGIAIDSAVAQPRPAPPVMK